MSKKEEAKKQILELQQISGVNLDAVIALIESIPSEQQEIEPDVRITNILKEIGMPSNLKGHRYVREAIKLCYDDQKPLDGFTVWLYPKLAEKYDTTPTRVERAIRHSIEVVFARGNYEEVLKYFGNTISPQKGKLTNNEFISGLADYLITNF